MKSSFGPIKLTGYRPVSLSGDVLLGSINSLDYLLWNYAFAALIFTGALAAYMPLAATLFLAASAMTAGIIALTSNIPISFAGPEEQAAAVLGMVAVTLNGQIAQFASADAAAATMFAIIAISSIVLALCFFLAARLNIGQLIQLLPFPVVCGYLAGNGWLFITTGIAMTSGLEIGFSGEALQKVVETVTLLRWLPALLLSIAIYWVLTVNDHWIVLPAGLLIGAGLFYVVAFSQGASLESLRVDGWVFSIESGDQEKSFGTLDFSSIHWGFVGSSFPSILLIVLMCLISTSIALSAIQTDTGIEANLNEELRSHGAANLGSAAFLGMPGATEDAATIVAGHLGATSRLFPLVACIIYTAAALLGGGIVSFVPKLVLGALVFLAGVQLLHGYALVACQKMKLQDVATVWVIFGVAVFVDFISGVVLGIGITSMLFIFRYSQIDVLNHSVGLDKTSSAVERNSQEREILKRSGAASRVFHLQGFVFFGSANALLERVKALTEGATAGGYFIFNFRRVSGMDVTAAQVMQKLLDMLERKQITPVFCALNEETAKALALAEVTTSGQCQVVDDCDRAIQWVEDRLLEKASCDQAGKSATDWLAEMMHDRDKAATLVGAMERVAVTEGGHLFHQGEHDTNVYLLMSGVIEIRGLSPEGKPLRLGEFRTGALFGEMAAYSDDRTRSASAVALTAAELYRLNPSRLLIENAPLAVAFHEMMAHRLVERLKSMNQRALSDV